MGLSGRYVSLIVFILGFLLSTLALLAPYWFYDKGPPILEGDTYSMSGYHLLFEENFERKSYGGLWLICRKTAVTICDTIEFFEIEWRRRAAFIMMFLALPLNLTAVGLYIRSLSREFRLVLPATFQTVAGVCNILAVAFFISSALYSHVHWTFFVACVSGVLLLVNGLCAISVVDSREKRPEDVVMLVDPPK